MARSKKEQSRIITALGKTVTEPKCKSRWRQLRNAMGIPDKNIWDQFTEAHFPLGENPGYEYDLEVVHFDRELDDEQLLAEFKKRGLELPEPEDGMSYAAAYSDEQTKCHIVVRLPRPWVNLYDHGYVFCLSSSGRGRFLSGNCILSRWRKYYRFLARRPRK